MGKLETFKIVFSHPEAVYFAGQVVSGSVHVVLKQPVKIKGISMKILGKGSVHWSGTSGETRSHFRAEEVYCDHKINLLCPESAAQENLTLPAGSFTYPFQMALPTSLPSSFEGKYGYVRYLVKAKIDRPWKFDHELKTAFTVLSVLDLNFEQPALKESYKTTQEKELGFCCFGGLVNIAVTVNRRCFVPGETICLNVKIMNNSNCLIPHCAATLDQDIEFLAKSTDIHCPTLYYQSKNRTEKIVHIDLNSIAVGKTEEWDNISLVVPSIPPSRLDGCQIINISYFVVVSISVVSTEFKLPVEITIGTVPLRGHHLPNYATITQPTALLPSSQDFDQPPPYSLDSGFFHNMPPPSYEESVQGRVTITEETDSEHIQGNLDWAPVYPIYRLPQPN